MAQGGFGVELKIMIGTVMETVVSLRNVEFPEFMKFVAETTGHDAEDGFYTAIATGKRRVQPFNATLVWDTNEATHAAVVTAFDSDEAVAMSIADPEGDEEIAFDAIIERVRRMSQQEDAMMAEVVIHPTGKPTIS
jgi:hypothetical protein